MSGLHLKSTAFVAALAVVTGLTFSVTPASAQGMTALEKQFSDLATLPDAERHAKIVEAAKKEGTLRMLPIMRSKRGRAHTKLFTDRYPFIKAEIYDMGSQDMADRFVVEEAAGRHLSDLVSLSVTDMAKVMEKNLGARYETPALKAVLPTYKRFLHPEHLWVPAYWKEHGISYNSQMVKEADAPKSWMDLCNPKYKGMASYEPEHNSWLMGMYQVFGGDLKKFEAFAKCVGDNEPILQKGHTTRLTLMLAGDHAIQGENGLYAGVKMALKNPKKAPFKAVYTAEIVAYPSVMTINKNAENPMASALYADWVLSDESQKYVKGEFRGPITTSHPYMPPTVTVVPAWFLDEKTSEQVHQIWASNVDRTGKKK